MWSLGYPETMVNLLACLLVALATAQSPSVLVIVADDVGWPEWGLMPGLQSLAAQGMTMERAYTWPICTPSRLALLLGTTPRRMGVGTNTCDPFVPTDTRIPLESVTLAEVFVPTHRTGFIGKWHMGRAPIWGELDQVQSGPHCQGFEFVRACNPSNLTVGMGSTGYKNWVRVDDGVMGLSTVYALDAERDAFLAWWSSTAKPRFGMLCWSAAHAPYQKAPGYLVGSTTRESYEHVVQYMDDALEGVLAQVDLATTYVVWIGDNGTPPDARPLGTPDGHWKYTTYEGGIHVPLVIAGPGIATGSTSTRLVSMTDLGATLCELAGLQAPPFIDSQSFANELGAFTGSSPRAFVFSERYASVYDDQAVVETESLIGVVTVRLKLRRVDLDGPAGPGASVDLVYDIRADPGELNPQPPSMLPPMIRNRLLGEMASVPARK